MANASEFRLLCDHWHSSGTFQALFPVVAIPRAKLLTSNSFASPKILRQATTYLRAAERGRMALGPVWREGGKGWHWPLGAVLAATPLH